MHNVQSGTIPTGDLPLLGGAIIRFTVYRDIPLANLVFYQWHLRMWTGGAWSAACMWRLPGQWLDRNFVYYGPDKDYIYTGEDVSDLIGGVKSDPDGSGLRRHVQRVVPVRATARHTPVAVDRHFRLYVQDCRSAVDVS